MPELPLTLISLARLGQQMRVAQRGYARTGSPAAYDCVTAAERRFDEALASVLEPSMFARPTPVESAEGEQD